MATYSELQVGDSATVSKTIAEADVYMFAGITGDLNPAHVDAVQAKDGMFGQRVVHGMLTGSFISTAIGMYLPGPGSILVGQKVQYRAPVFIGDTITARVECTSKDDAKKWATFTATVTNQDGKTVIKGECDVIPPPDEDAAS